MIEMIYTYIGEELYTVVVVVVKDSYAPLLHSLVYSTLVLVCTFTQLYNIVASPAFIYYVK